MQGQRQLRESIMRHEAQKAETARVCRTPTQLRPSSSYIIAHVRWGRRCKICYCFDMYFLQLLFLFARSSSLRCWILRERKDARRKCRNQSECETKTTERESVADRTALKGYCTWYPIEMVLRHLIFPWENWRRIIFYANCKWLAVKRVDESVVSVEVYCFCDTL